MGVEHGNAAASAGSSPVYSQFEFGFDRFRSHAFLFYRFNFKCLFNFTRSYLEDRFGHFIHQFGKLFPFTGTDPFKPQTFLFYPHLGDEFFQKLESPETFIISFLVMAVSGVATAYKNSVGALFECFQNKCWFYPAGTHDPYDPDVRGIMKPGSACKISAGIGTPVAEKSDDSGTEIHNG